MEREASESEDSEAFAHLTVDTKQGYSSDDTVPELEEKIQYDDERALELGKRSLEILDSYIKGVPEMVGVDGLTTSQRVLAHLDDQINRFKGDAKSFIELVRFVAQTKPEHACDPDESGKTPVQKLWAFPVPDMLKINNTNIRTAMLVIMDAIPRKWVFCQYWFGKSSLRAKEEKLRFELMRNCEDPCDRFSAIVKCARDVSEAGSLEDFRSCEGYDFFKKIEDMKKRHQICEGEYQELWRRSPIVDYLEGKKAEDAVACGKRLVQGECGNSLNYLSNLSRCFAGYPGEVCEDVQKEVYYWLTHVGQLKGGKKAFIELILFAVQRSSCPWECDETGLNSLQRLSDFPVPTDDPEARDAMRKTKKRVIDLWVQRPQIEQASEYEKEFLDEREEKEDSEEVDVDAHLWASAAHSF